MLEKMSPLMDDYESARRSEELERAFKQLKGVGGFSDIDEYHDDVMRICNRQEFNGMKPHQRVTLAALVSRALKSSPAAEQKDIGTRAEEIYKDPELMKVYAEKGIGVEMCPTSNFQTRAVKRPEDYPLREFLDAGLLATISTDNRTVSGVTLSGELTLAREKMGMDDQSLIRLQQNAARVSFADEPVKAALLDELKGWEA